MKERREVSAGKVCEVDVGLTLATFWRFLTFGLSYGRAGSWKFTAQQPYFKSPLVQPFEHSNM